MSYDLFVQDLPDGISSVSEIPDAFKPRGLGLARTALVDAIRSIWPGVDGSDPRWLTVNALDYSIEFNLRDDDPIADFAIHLRGSKPPFEKVADLLSSLSVRALDVQDPDGLFDSHRAVRSFEEWADFRDEVT